jgi:hypothetical protein
MRDFGYTLPSALADLIDNSLAARANIVSIIIEPSAPTAHIAVMDDGGGMNEDRLIEAMRMGTMGPNSARATTDLGRFGLGMKTASLSQGRCVTVMSKRGRDIAIRRWDLEHVRRTKDWQLLSELTPTASIYYERILKLRHGTAVVIEQLDRASFINVPEQSQTAHLASALESVRSHLGMVFHRFIEEDGLVIRLGESGIPAWDPYLLGESTRLAPEKLKVFGQGVLDVTPFVLPHHSRLTDEQHERAAGPMGWNAHQGFYIYRCRRLIVPGTWLNLRLKKEEHYKLARLRVDLPNTMDHEWQLNVMKSHVSAPAALKDDFRRIAADVRRQASEVYRVRGERQAPTQTPAEHFVWRREATRTGVKYRVDRRHPLLQAVLHSGCMHDDLLSSVVSLIETTVPIAAMLQEPQKAIDGTVSAAPPVEIDALVDMLIHAEQYFVRTGKSRDDARRLLLFGEPFIRFRDAVLDRLKQRTQGVNQGDEK